MLWLDGQHPAVTRLAEGFDPERMDALLLLMPTAGAFGYAGAGDFHLDPEGRLTRRAPEGVAPFVYAGVQIVKPALFAEDTPDAFSTNLIWDRAQARGRLFGLRHDGLWFHIGTPEALAETEAHLRAKPSFRPET
jgi:MurNAc alpha-1-phosphate uridylyltransferase